MRPKIAIGLLIIFCFAEIRPLLPFLDYLVNYKYISEVLCINKDKPMSTCNGKCYLSQQLKKAQESEKQDKNIPTVKFERIPMILCDYKFPKFAIMNSVSQKHNTFYIFSIKDLTISPPTPPPKC
ncbi:MAG: hypothetical protein ACWA45_10575 [Flavobacteriales bacterium]